MTTTLKIVCAWCGKDMDTKDGQGVTGTSHGICDECIEKLTTEESESEEGGVTDGNQNRPKSNTG